MIQRTKQTYKTIAGRVQETRTKVGNVTRIGSLQPLFKLQSIIGRVNRVQITFTSFIKSIEYGMFQLYWKTKNKKKKSLESNNTHS